MSFEEYSRQFSESEKRYKESDKEIPLPTRESVDVAWTEYADAVTRETNATHAASFPESLTTAWLKTKIGPYFVHVTARHGCTEADIKANIVNLINAVQDCKAEAIKVFPEDDPTE
jgi:hypothetical protein